MTTRILASSSHSFENECKEIHDSWGRLNSLIPAFASRTQIECWQIRETYKGMYGEDLITLLQKKSMEAIQQDDTNYKALVEIFVGRKSSHIALINQAYQSKYKRQLDQDIINIEPPHRYQKILGALATSHKAHKADVSQHIAKCDARRFYETGEGSPGAIDEGVVLEIFTKRSIAQLKLTFSFYKHIYGHDYTKSITKGNSGDFEDALKMVITCLCNPPNYYAKMFASIKGKTADRGTLARVMVSRAEIDLAEIQRVFKVKYGIELTEAIRESIPSGDYRDILLTLASKTITAPSRTC
ncbi:hypothetical protein DITRI_Ditri06bG0126900 [Diplodiscus trichospermus]